MTHHANTPRSGSASLQQYHSMAQSAFSSSWHPSLMSQDDDGDVSAGDGDDGRDGRSDIHGSHDVHSYNSFASIRANIVDTLNAHTPSSNDGVVADNFRTPSTPSGLHAVLNDSLPYQNDPPPRSLVLASASVTSHAPFIKKSLSHHLHQRSGSSTESWWRKSKKAQQTARGSLGNISASQLQGPKPIPVHACTNCKDSKAKCDHGRPCERCTRKGIGDSCVDGVHEKRGRKPHYPPGHPQASHYIQKKEMIRQQQESYAYSILSSSSSSAQYAQSSSKSMSTPRNSSLWPGNLQLPPSVWVSDLPLRTGGQGQEGHANTQFDFAGDCEGSAAEVPSGLPHYVGSGYSQDDPHGVPHPQRRKLIPSPNPSHVPSPSHVSPQAVTNNIMTERPLVLSLHQSVVGALNRRKRTSAQAIGTNQTTRLQSPYSSSDAQTYRRLHGVVMLRSSSAPPPVHSSSDSEDEGNVTHMAQESVFDSDSDSDFDNEDNLHMGAGLDSQFKSLALSALLQLADQCKSVTAHSNP